MKQIVSDVVFAADCEKFIERIERGALHEIEITRDGQVIARLLPGAEVASASWHGFMRGSVTIPEGFDLTAPVWEGPVDARDGDFDV